jgi:hypothetical protein
MTPQLDKNQLGVIGYSLLVNGFKGRLSGFGSINKKKVKLPWNYDFY